MAIGLGYTPVLRAQENLARTLQQGISGLANYPLQQAELGLRKSQIEHQMGRERVADLRAQEMLERQKQQAEFERDIANRRFGLQEKQFGLQEKQFGLQEKEFDINKQLNQSELQNKALYRQQLTDQIAWQTATRKYTEPVLKIQAMQAEREGKLIEFQNRIANEPIPLSSYVSSIITEQMPPEDLDRMIAQGDIPKALKTAKAKIITGEDGMQYIQKQDGSLANSYDTPMVLEIFESVLQSQIDPIKYTEEKLPKMKNELALLSTVRSTAPLSPDDEARFQQLSVKIPELEGKIVDPAWRAEQYEAKADRDFGLINKLKPIGLDTSVFENNYNRNVSKAAAERNKLAVASEREFKKEIEQIKVQAPGSFDKEIKSIARIYNIPESLALDIYRDEANEKVRTEQAKIEIDARTRNLVRPDLQAQIPDIVNSVFTKFNVGPKQFEKYNIEMPEMPKGVKSSKSYGVTGSLEEESNPLNLNRRAAEILFKK